MDLTTFILGSLITVVLYEAQMYKNVNICFAEFVYSVHASIFFAFPRKKSSD